jgi:hypothetical protein
LLVLGSFMALRRTFGLLLAVLSAATLDAQAIAGSNGVSVSFSDTTLSIKISKSTKLVDVVAAVCATAHLECDVHQGALQQEIAPQSIQGGWQGTIAQLLNGAKVNYVVIPPSSSSSGSLLVSQASVDASSTARSSQSPSPTFTASEPPPESEQDEQAVAGPSAPAAEESASTTSSPSEPMPTAGPESSLPSGMAYSPFPDAHGNPVAMEATNEPMQYSIFPDAHGNAVPSEPSNEPLAYGIFPDSNGNPVPAQPPTGEGLEYGIFPDANGNPVPLPH